VSSPTIAIVGASSDRTKFGNKAVRAFIERGYTVYPVNPRGGMIEGLTAHRSLAEVPAGRLNRISVYLPPELTLKLLPEIAARGCDELWLNPGSESPAVIEAARALGLELIQACSIINIGVDPSRLT